ncbi:MAG: HlyD family efflux transporter periplasmic adaptor subunit [Paludibacter sp.]|nr:HlyD family efflux transporter periplasmic adaptor subunit [Paludibacter sp.]
MNKESKIQNNGNINAPLGDGGYIELRSDEVQEILSRPPHALIRYGISVISGVMLILFIGSFFFRYPDIVQGDVVITTENPPVWMVAKSTGKIKELVCKDKQEVHQGDILAVIDNSASTKDVQTINQSLSTVLISDSGFYIPTELLTKSFELGTLQSNFSAFAKAAMNYDNFLTLNLTIQEKKSLKKQIGDRTIYSSDLQKQLEMKKQELILSKSSYERDKRLFNQKVISSSDMEIAEQTYLNKRQELQQLETSISLQNVEFSQMKETVNKLSIQYLQEKHQLFSELKSSQRELLAAIENWQQSYLLTASQSGVVTFNTFWKRNQYINTGDKVFAIVSHHPGQLIGKIKVPASGSGKVLIGQMVNIKVANYPYLEYGVLQAKIRNISLISNNDFYTVAVDFPKGLHSTVNKELKFTGELNGTAEIITENQSLMERFMTPVKFLINKFFDK